MASPARRAECAPVIGMRRRTRTHLILLGLAAALGALVYAQLRHEDTLAPEPLILMDLPHTRDYFLSLFYAAGVAPQVRYRSTSFEAVRTLVGNGLGYAILNLKPAADTTYDGTRVACVPLSDLHRPLHIVLVTLKKIAKRRMVATFQDFARGYLKDWQARSVVARPGRRRP